MRYIDADLIEYEPMCRARGNGMYEDCEIAYKDQIDDIPTADVRENVKGNLVNIEPSLTLIDAIPTPSGGALLSMDKSCSKCKTPIPPNICNNVWFKYCPFCGADLSVERADT